MFKIKVDIHTAQDDRLLRLVTEILDRLDSMEDRMATLTEAVANIRTQIAQATDRVRTDVAELRRVIEAQGALEAEVDAALTSLEEGAAELANLDPDPNFPAATPTDVPTDVPIDTGTDIGPVNPPPDTGTPTP